MIFPDWLNRCTGSGTIEKLPAYLFGVTTLVGVARIGGVDSMGSKGVARLSAIASIFSGAAYPAQLRALVTDGSATIARISNTQVAPAGGVAGITAISMEA